MSVGAAIRITSADEARVIEHASALARREGVPCFVISVVHDLPYDVETEDDLETVARNLELIAESKASPVMQQGDDIAATLLTVARSFGVRTLFLQSGSARLLGRSIAEQLLYLDPPFDVVVIGSE